MAAAGRRVFRPDRTDGPSDGSERRLKMRVDLDMPVDCADGTFGELADVVIDPSTRHLTHLVVQPHDRQDHARLLPISGAHRGEGSEGISLACTVAEISQLNAIQESAYVRRGEFPLGGRDWDVGIQEIYALPDYGSLGPEALGAGMPGIEYDQHLTVSYHRVPKGGVEVRSASPVNSTDGDHLGHVVGFILDDHAQITHLVLEHGHLWGKHTVAIPSQTIERFETDEVVLGLSSDELKALKPVFEP